MELKEIGVSPAKEKQFNSKNIFTVEDLIKYIPFRYNDFRYPKKFNELNDGDTVSVIGKIKTLKNINKRIMATIECDGETLKIVWFNQQYIMRILKINTTYIFCGKISLDKYSFCLQMVNPIVSCNINKYKKIVPVYSKIKGMSEDYLSGKIDLSIKESINSEYLEPQIIKDFNLISMSNMAKKIHQPKDFNDVNLAKQRIIFDDLFQLAYTLEYNNVGAKKNTSIDCPKADSVNQLLKTLPFELTDGNGGQLYVVRGIYKKIRKHIRTNSLVQGDVGCGKTFVAMLLMLIMAENNYQSVLMAPTNVLAYQHYLEFKDRLKIFDFVHVVFLNGTMKVKEKRKILSEIQTGKANIIIGTHAVISDCVKFYNLGLSIVDEEHRFGVAQRKLIDEKVKGDVHHVTMSATPIPRSLGLSLYGDGTDIYTITKMPSGRKQVKTIIETNNSKSYQFIYDQIKLGRQAYVICPLIDDSNSEKMQGVESVNVIYDKLKKFFLLKPEVKIAMINGKMKQAEVDKILDDFHNNIYNLLISTTIVEVGVNVPNATIMMIKNAERFGLAQLHQLRGRVGRGKYQSYCILSSPKEEVERLNIMTTTNDGFKIAEKDLNIRGMGDFIGTKQTGQYKNVMLMLSNPMLYQKIKDCVVNILKDPIRKKRYEFLSKEVNNSSLK